MSTKHRESARVSYRRLLLLVATLALSGCSAPEEGGSAAPAESTTQAGGGQDAAEADPIDSFAAFAAQMPADGEIAADALSDGLRRLAGAAGAATVPLETTVDLRVSAEHVLLNPESPDVAKTVREALDKVTDALDDRVGDADAARLRAATDAISPDAPLTGQAAALREYFQATAAALASGRG